MDRATHDRRTTRRMFSIVAVLGLVIGLVDAVAPSTQAQVPGANGRIVFSRFEKGLPNGDGGHGDLATYTVNPDGSHEQLLFPGSSHNPHWSPDGSEVAIFAPDSAGGETLSATIVNPDTGTYRQLPIPDPALPIGCTWWSPDGLRLACVGAEQSVNGIYTIRSSDGGGLQQVTSNPTGEDNLGGYSPDGKRLFFERTTAEGDEALYTVLVNGGGLRRSRRRPSRGSRLDPGRPSAPRSCSRPALPQTSVARSGSSTRTAQGCSRCQSRRAVVRPRKERRGAA